MKTYKKKMLRITYKELRLKYENDPSKKSHFELSL